LLQIQKEEGGSAIKS